MLLKVIYDKGWPHGKHNRQTACDAIDIYQQTGVHKVYLDHTDMVNSKNRWCIFTTMDRGFFDGPAV